MNHRKLSRRDFNRLSMAAFSGVVAGATVGCSRENGGGGAPTTGGPTPGTTPPGDGAQVAGNPWTGEVHVCRGLNACMNQGASGENACAGQGSCATAEHHECHTQNTCKYQGGCQETVGQNECAGKGECAVPLSEDAWKKARASFEAAMAKINKEVGQPPAAGAAAPDTEGGT